MSSVNYGTKRIVTGAHYGARDWLVQRARAVVIIAFTAILLAQLLLTAEELSVQFSAYDDVAKEEARYAHYDRPEDPIRYSDEIAD